MIPSSAVFDQSILSALLEYDAVVQDYRGFFALLDWQLVEQWQQQRGARGRPGHPLSAYLKAFLIRIREGFLYTTQLRRFLIKHPLLVIDLGFQLVLDKDAPYGFDVEQTVPCDYWLRHQLRSLDQGLLQALLHATVAALQEEIPGLGEIVASARQAHLRLGCAKTTRVSTSKIVSAKSVNPRATPIAGWASSAVPTRSSPMGPRKKSRSTCGLWLWGGGSH